MNYIEKIEQAFENQITFTTNDAKRTCKGLSNEYAKLLLHELVKKKKIFRITKGVYSFKDDIYVTGFAYQPFYYGLETALTLHKLWEQETNPIIITPRQVRNGLKKFEETNYLLKRINRNMFFGYESIKYYDFYVPISDLEKTLIDLYYYKKHISTELKNEFKKKINYAKLNEYLKKIPEKTRKKIQQEFTN